MLEETLIRENASKKVTARNIPKKSGPPVTLITPVDKSPMQTSAAFDQRL